MPQLPIPPLTREIAMQKVQAAEEARNTCDPERFHWPDEDRRLPEGQRGEEFPLA